MLQAIELLGNSKIEVSNTRDIYFGANQISVLVLSKIEIPVLVSFILHQLIVKSARPNRFLVRIELGNVYDRKSMYPLIVGICSVHSPVELKIAPLAVLT